MPSSSSQFRTFQTARTYDEALRRHSQSIIWTRSVLCPCFNPETSQPDYSCVLCYGRGRIYKEPGPQRVYNEIAKHGNTSIYPKYTPLVPDEFRVRLPARNDSGLTKDVLATLSEDRKTLILSNEVHDQEHVYIDYKFDPVLRNEGQEADSVEISGSGATLTLRLVPDLFSNRYGKRNIHGRLLSVESVMLVAYDSDNIEISSDDLTDNTSIENIDSDNLIISASANVQSLIDSAMELLVYDRHEFLVAYTYNRPFQFLINNISERQKYTSPYISQEADATLTVPSWARVSPNDLFTVLAAEQIGEEIIHPESSSTMVDSVKSYFDLVRILEIVDKDGTVYVNPDEPVVDIAEIVDRHDIKWNIQKPTVPYTVQFLYNPTYVAIEGFPTLRTAENKQFVNKINLKKWSQSSTIQHTH